MADCHGRQHTGLCGARVLLCVLFHVHLHQAHSSDIGSDIWQADSSEVSDTHDNGTSAGVQPLSELRRYTRRLFDKYAAGDVMTLEEFDKFLTGLGLGHLQTTLENAHSRDLHSHDDYHFTEDSRDSEDDSHNHNGDTHKSDDGELLSSVENTSRFDSSSTQPDPSSNTDSAIHKRSITEPPSNQNSVHERNEMHSPDGEKTEVVRRDTSRNENHLDKDECFSSRDYFGLFASIDLTVETFQRLFPLLLHQLDSRACQGPTAPESPLVAPRPFWSLPASVWLCSLLAITVISLVGLLSVAIIPLTSKVIYNHLLQFLVALAVGTLTGDACLHLLPHALDSSAHSHGADGSHHSDHSAVFKGLVALAGIYFFFLVERLMKIYSTKKRELKKKRKQPMSAQESGLMAGKEGSDATDICVKPESGATAMSCEKMLMVIHKDVKHMAQEAHDDVHRNCDVDVNDAVGGHGHHGHAHGPLPQSVADVAWMVVMGDGIHNFGDGLAIGAAFASSISVGLSTTVAVFCHELPHEIGDFAVLLRAGMSAKQAIMYNILSSILALIGMLIGLLVGNLYSTSLWIFALIGGMFIYVALVDMMPELTSVDPQSGEHPMVHFALQNAGMLLGFTIMLLIAIFEDDIKFTVL